MDKINKILCVCKGGIVRSPAMATVLKLKYSADVLTASLDFNSGETLIMLCDWADLILVPEDWMKERLLAHIYKVMVLPVGPDVWGNTHDSGLLDLVNALLKERLTRTLRVVDDKIVRYRMKQTGG